MQSGKLKIESLGNSLTTRGYQYNGIGSKVSCFFFFFLLGLNISSENIFILTESLLIGVFMERSLVSMEGCGKCTKHSLLNI